MTPDEALRQLATANALLEQCADGEVDSFAIRAHLDSLPAPEEGRCVRCWLDECQCPQPAAPTRTNADREQDVFPGMPPAGWGT